MEYFLFKNFFHKFEDFRHFKENPVKSFWTGKLGEGWWRFSE